MKLALWWMASGIGGIERGLRGWRVGRVLHGGENG